jgi:phage baseplate assembly protein W
MPAGAKNPLSNELLFSDLSFTFTPHPVTGRLPVLKNQAAIQNALKNLILTNKFERPYEPLFGGNILALLFEQADPFIDYQIRKQIQDAVSNFEQRVELLDVNVDVQSDSNTVDINITFFVENERDPVQLNINLQRVR